jgi:hypothetical protein
MKKKTRQIILAFCLGIIISLVGNLDPIRLLSPVLGQNIRPEMVAELVYQRLPNLPLENEYISKTTNQVATNSTLMLRFIRYHEYVKSRPVKYRLDWQLTFADYFDLNEPIQTDRYPGFDTLTASPLESDRAIITKLNRAQRNQLIDTLLAIYNPQTETPAQQPATTPSNSPTQRKPNTPVLPQPGDADLLLP